MLGSSGFATEDRGRILARAVLRILVIEDEARIRSFVARGLEVDGFAVDGADNGQDGLERAVRGTYDLVVLDLLLPRLDGLSVLRELHRRSPDLPVVVLSARADLRTKLRCFELGANDYLAKPFAVDELLARVRVQLRSRDHGNGGVLEAGTLLLDVARRRARIGDGEIDLSDREFRLLHHLVKHAGEVVTRDSILSAVWGYHFDPRSNVVDVCVRRLRRKLGDQAPIETVRHAGYRLPSA
jgi:two-component system, OmpR family, copper resistance phosphate regulon response regulator CusR